MKVPTIVYIIYNILYKYIQLTTNSFWVQQDDIEFKKWWTFRVH